MLSSEPKEISELWPGEELLNDVPWQLGDGLSFFGGSFGPTLWVKRKFTAPKKEALQVFVLLALSSALHAAHCWAIDSYYLAFQQPQICPFFGQEGLH